MDVQTTLSDMLYNLENGDRHSTIESMQNLIDWMQKGGAMPEIEYMCGDPMTGRLNGWHVPQ